MGEEIPNLPRRQKVNLETVLTARVYKGPPCRGEFNLPRGQRKLFLKQCRLSRTLKGASLGGCRAMICLETR